MFHHNCHYWHFSLKLHLTLSRLKGDEALFSDILNHFTDLLDKNRAALPSSLLLKSQKAAISFTQKCQGFFSFFFLLMHTTPYMLDVKCAGKTNRLVGKELRQQHTVTSSFIVIQGSPKSWSQKTRMACDIMTCERLILCGTLPTSFNCGRDFPFCPPLLLPSFTQCIQPTNIRIRALCVFLENIHPK